MRPETPRHPSSSEDLSGTQVGQYTLQRLLARGGMSDVYLAATSSHELVAVKVMRAGGDESQLLRRFAREQHLLANLRHPGIVAWRAVGELPDGRPYVVTEHIDGQHLDEYCYALPASQILSVLSKVCDAVGAAHARGVVHRDLKPVNVLVTPAGCAVVIDFGVAYRRDARREATVTVGLPPMTPYYASPESFEAGACSPRSDVYSLGILLRDLLQSANGWLSARQQRDGNRVVARCCHVDPQDRYADAAALAADLRRVQVGRRLSWVPAIARLVRRQRRLLLAAGITVAALTVAATTAVQSSRSIQDARHEASSVSEFLVRLLDLAGPDAHGPELTLPDAWRYAEAAIPITLADHPYGESRVRMAYGRAYAKVENWSRALRHLERAIELLRGNPAAHPGSVKWCERLAAQCRMRLSD